MTREQLLGQLAPVHASRHNHVGEQQIRLTTPLDRLDRLPRILGGHHLVAERAELRELISIAPYAVVAFWITPYIPDSPADPVWIEAKPEDGNIVLRWRPNAEPFFYSYEVYLIAAGEPDRLVSPMPLRSAMWIDTAPPPGMRKYAVRAVTASGIKSNLVTSDPVMVPDRR